MKSSVCIEMIFTEYPFIERIDRAAEAGFDAIEFWNWDNKDLPAIKEAVGRNGLEIAAFQSNLGGTLVHPDQRDDFVRGIETSLGKAQHMGAARLFLLTDELAEDRSVRFQFPELSDTAKYQNVLNGLRVLAPLAEAAEVTLVMEPLNTTVDHAGYYLNHSAQAFDMVRKVDSPRIRLLYDIYHMQVMEGNIIHTLTSNLDVIDHIHVADVPGRHQPGTGELNYGTIFRALREAGYDRYVGFEFEPTVPSEEAAALSLELLHG